MSSKEVFEKLKIANPQLIGKGGEGDVFAIGNGRVLKIYNKPNPEYLQALMALQKKLAGFSFPFKTPQILEIGEALGESYSLENLLPGETLDKKLPLLNEEQKQTALLEYFKALNTINSVRLDDYPYGQLLDVEGAIKTNTWSEYLLSKLDQELAGSRSNLIQNIKDFEEKVKLLRQLIVSETNTEEKRLVHGDYYFNNVLVDRDLKITSVLDFSIHSVVGDPRLDAASILFLKMDKNIKPEQMEMLYQLAEEIYGNGTRRILDIYGLYYAIYYFRPNDTDLVTHTWCLQTLNNERVWKSLSI